MLLIYKALTGPHQIVRCEAPKLATDAGQHVAAMDTSCFSAVGYEQGTHNARMLSPKHALYEALFTERSMQDSTYQQWTQVASQLWATSRERIMQGCFQRSILYMKHCSLKKCFLRPTPEW
eukprot:1161092-Pelagomonas_calceolata.AAC.9